MKNKSSNKYMKNYVSYLENVQLVEPKQDIYNAIQEKINAKNKIPFYAVAVAASIILMLFVGEYFFVNLAQKTNSDVISFVSIENNLLYHE